MIVKHITWVHYLNQTKEFISKLDDSSISISSLGENISVPNQRVTEENSLQLQMEVEVKILTENEKHCNSLSSILNEEKNNK